MARTISQGSIRPLADKGQRFSLTICHLYPDLMDTYGDKGNITAIQKRCKWRGIHTELINHSINDERSTINNIDLFFFGGGQDKAQEIVGKDLQKKSASIKKSIESGSVLLSICGGYQLLQKYFKTSSGQKIPGIGLFDAYTIGSNTRMINNLLIEIEPNLQAEIKSTYSTIQRFNDSTTSLVGFENHSGKTYLGPGVKPLGTVIKGSGNNGKDKTEGAIYKNAFGCYLHGSLLPKNPHFADFLISKALERKYGYIKLKPLDDAFEWMAHKKALKSI